MQLVDELSMIYTTCIMCYATFAFDKSRLFSQLLALGLLGLSIFITVSGMISLNIGRVVDRHSFITTICRIQISTKMRMRS